MAVTYIAVSALSHIGAVPGRQEDSLVAGPWTLCATVTESPQTLFFAPGTPLVAAVAGGLGGHPAGEVASAMAARQPAQSGPLPDSGDKIREALSAGNREVHAAAGRDPALTAVGTAVAGVVVTADLVLAVNAGDSRVYAAGPGGVHRLSTGGRLSGDGLPPASSPRCQAAAGNWPRLALT